MQSEIVLTRLLCKEEGAVVFAMLDHNEEAG